MKTQRIDPLTELGKKSPEMLGFVQNAVQTVFANYPKSHMTPEQMSRIEGDITAVFDDAQARGASLPDRTIVALGFPASRHVRVTTVWHIAPWWYPLEKCCVHLGTTGRMGQGSVDLWLCMDSQLLHLVTGETPDDRVCIAWQHVHLVKENLHEGDERSVQVAIAARVCEKRPEILQLRPKRLM